MLKINVGSGFKRQEGFLNLDYDANCNPDYVVDLEKDKLPFEDNSVDEVIARHVLEHLGDGYFHFLKELYRVCCDGAIIHIVVPHPKHDWYLNDPTHKRPITIDGMRLFSKTYNRYCESIDDGASKLGLFFDVDFEVVWSEYEYDDRYKPMFVEAYGDQEKMQLVDQYIYERCNIITEIKMQLMVIKNNE